MRKTLRIRALLTFSIVATVLFVVLTYSTPAFAQSLTTGAISGTVTDQSNAVMPGASVTVINVGSGDTRTGTTNSTGVPAERGVIFEFQRELNRRDERRRRNVAESIGRNARNIHHKRDATARPDIARAPRRR